MSKRKSLWLDRAIVISPYYYRLCLTEKDFHKELKMLKVPKKNWPEYLSTDHAHATLNYFQHPSGKRCAIINMCESHKKYTIEQTYALLVHEAIHLWQQIKEVIGESNPSSEFEAYAMQNITNELMDSYKYQTRKKK